MKRRSRSRRLNVNRSRGRSSAKPTKRLPAPPRKGKHTVKRSDSPTLSRMSSPFWNTDAGTPRKRKAPSRRRYRVGEKFRSSSERERYRKEGGKFLYYYCLNGKRSSFLKAAMNELIKLGSPETVTEKKTCEIAFFLVDDYFIKKHKEKQNSDKNSHIILNLLKTLGKNIRNSTVSGNRIFTLKNYGESGGYAIESKYYGNGDISIKILSSGDIREIECTNLNSLNDAFDYISRHLDEIKWNSLSSVVKLNGEFTPTDPKKRESYRKACGTALHISHSSTSNKKKTFLTIAMHILEKLGPPKTVEEKETYGIALLLVDKYCKTTNQDEDLNLANLLNVLKQNIQSSTVSGGRNFTLKNHGMSGYEIESKDKEKGDVSIQILSTGYIGKVECNNFHSLDDALDYICRHLDEIKWNSLSSFLDVNGKLEIDMWPKCWTPPVNHWSNDIEAAG